MAAGGRRQHVQQSANRVERAATPAPAEPLAGAGWQLRCGSELPKRTTLPPSKPARLTISENTRAMANMGLLVPCSTPMAVVRPMTCGAGGAGLGGLVMSPASVGDVARSGGGRYLATMHGGYKRQD